MTSVSWIFMAWINALISCLSVKSLPIVRNAWAGSTLEKSFSISFTTVITKHIISSARSVDWSSISMRSTSMSDRHFADHRGDKAGKDASFVRRMSSPLMLNGLSILINAPTSPNLQSPRLKLPPRNIPKLETYDFSVMARGPFSWINKIENF